MNIAYLIIAHHQPKLLARLIGALASPGAGFFVHVDRRTELAPFKAAAGLPDVRFLDDDQRVTVNWGGFSQVQATLNLIRQAREQHPFDRYCLLSGVDYPLKPQAEILAAFSGGSEFIQIQRRLLPNGSMPLERRVKKFYFGEVFPLVNPRAKQNFLSKIFRAIEYRAPRKYPANMDLFYGSQWWCLTGAAIEAILRKVAYRGDFLKWCRLTTCSDEIFFQSLLKRTEFGDRVRYETDARTQEDGETFPSMHYVDWWTKNPTAPKVLEMDDLAALRESEALFARKFDEGRSAALLDAIDAMRAAGIRG